MWQMTGDMWNIPCKIWHMPYDTGQLSNHTWHITRGQLGQWLLPVACGCCLFWHTTGDTWHLKQGKSLFTCHVSCDTCPLSPLKIKWYLPVTNSNTHTPITNIQQTLLLLTPYTMPSRLFQKTSKHFTEINFSEVKEYLKENLGLVLETRDRGIAEYAIIF